ncbi:hypothetical protein BDV95DRAFT_595524 [Massariosphaeria phaeospora]|uniref:Uncharacterized protein n=1 Tax=Massariosphaeria phaeospora TaxID=100035 RepID=A0A7C8I6Y3_9PLEO|nr:hypothetical protein BDV95DRAFT_595524 [Massariosphaeria phaeospora]
MKLLTIPLTLFSISPLLTPAFALALALDPASPAPTCLARYGKHTPFHAPFHSLSPLLSYPPFPSTPLTPPENCYAAGKHLGPCCAEYLCIANKCRPFRGQWGTTPEG